MQIQALGHLPTPSSTALRLYELIQSDDVGIPEVAAVIKGDVNLTVRLLRMANRSGYVQRPVASVEDALMRVGTKSVASLAIGLAVIDDAVASAPQGSHLYLDLCRQSLAAAVIAEWFCDQPGVPVSTSDLFTCALLARVGQLALLRFYPQSYAEMIRQEAVPAELLERERTQLAIDHQVITLTLLREWGFPEIFIDAIRLSEGNDEDRMGEDRRHVMAHVLGYAWEMAPALAQGKQALLSLHVQRALATLGEEPSEEESRTTVERLTKRWLEWGNLGGKGKERNISDDPERMDEDLLTVMLIGFRTDRQNPVQDALEARGYAVSHAGGLGEALVFMATGEINIVMIHEGIGSELSSGQISLLGAWLKEQERAVLVIQADEVDENEKHELELLSAGVDAIMPSSVSVIRMVAYVKRLSERVKLAKTLNRERLAHRRLLSELVLTTRKLHTETLTDPLSGLANRRMADVFLKRHWAQLERRQTVLSCLIIDLDNFKQINDRYGHDAGDTALRAFAQVLKRHVRQDDLAVRLGGDEFLVICPLARATELQVLRQRLLQATAQLNLETGPLCFSMGIAESDLTVMKVAEDLLKAADLQLMKNKRQR